MPTCHSDAIVRVELRSSLRSIPPRAWDELVGCDDPFVEHAFLATLETSGSVGPGTGWEPLYVTVWDGERLCGALPLYIKSHSYGEYIFDWSWATAALNAGIRYYPKLVSMVPFTPATGTRILIAPDQDAVAVAAALTQGCFEAAEQVQASSLHLLFLTEQERELMGAQAPMFERLTLQFHWTNAPYPSFDAFVACMRSSVRKQVCKERRRVHKSGIEVRVLSGEELERGHWDDLYRFYASTCARKGSPTYLTRRFFEQAAEALAPRAFAVLAYRGDLCIAGSLNFEKGRRIYGRYWGCDEGVDFLHFEVCYYRLIERAIAKGAERFEAGAQGLHKLRRGLMPAEVHSLHWVRHPGLRSAVGRFLLQEQAQVRDQMAVLARHGPFRKE